MPTPNERNMQILLAARPNGPVTPEHFRLVEAAVPEVGDGQFLVRNHYLSLDPYMRGRMDAGRSYAEPQKLGEVMLGATVGAVVASRHPDFQVGDKVMGSFGWQLYGLSDGRGVRKVDERAPLSAYLGVLGMTGVTAWYGLHEICAARAGETLVVSAASGAVGAVVGQLGKLAGLYVVGIAGGPEKCAYVTGELGFDACVDHRGGNLAGDLTAAVAKQGHGRIDCLFENVGGLGFDTAVGLMNDHGRIALCGLIAGYEGGEMGLSNVRSLLTNRVKLQGFIIAEHLDRWPAALGGLVPLFAAGKLKYRESVAQGLPSAPEAFIGMLAGKNFGKQLVKLI
jgi:NADPH-dependent curcumin reductase CurA